MSAPRPPRGPQFRAYPLPQSTPFRRPDEPAEGADVLSGGRPDQDNTWLQLTLAAAAVAVLALLVLSLLAGARGSGALIATLAAATAVAVAVAGRAQLRSQGRHQLVLGSQLAAVVAAVAAVALLLVSPGTSDPPPIAVPSPRASAAPSNPLPPVFPQPAPSLAPPSTEPFPDGPSPTPQQTSPGSGGGFGNPTQPGPPLTSLSTDKGLLTGHVVNSSGAPVAGASIVITRANPSDTSDAPGCPTRVTAKTDANGDYRVELCQLGEQLGYAVKISSGGVAASTKLYVNSGQTTVYDVLLALRHA